MFFFFGCDFFQQPPSRGIVAANIFDHLTIAVDGDTFRHEVFLDHVLQCRSLCVLRMAPVEQSFGRKVRLTAQLHDALGDGICIEEAALRAGTIGYEILTRLGARFSRRYMEA